jgi:hypothetical protein
MSKILLVIGLILFLAGLSLSIMFLEDFPSFAVGVIIALVGFVVALGGVRTKREAGYAERKGGLQGVVRNLKREGNLVNFWLEVTGQAGKAVPVEAYLKEDAVGEGDTVWVRGSASEGGTLRTSEVQNLTRTQGFSGIGSPQLRVGGTKPSRGVRVLLIVGWLILSSILALVATFIVMNLSFISDLLSDPATREAAGWVVLIGTFAILQVVMYKSGALSSRNRLPQMPTGISTSSVAFDPRTGILEATARNVSPYPDSKMSGGAFWKAKMNRVVRFRAELTDTQGNITQYVPVEIECDENKWIGQISEGDKVRVQGNYGTDGILHAERAIDLTTKSVVGKK